VIEDTQSDTMKKKKMTEFKKIKHTEEIKMKIIQTVAAIGLGALLGVGAGYKMFGADQESCHTLYTKQIGELEKKYAGVPATPGMAAAKDLTIEYVVSESAKFKGLTFRDELSGKQGVITKNALFGNNNYDMQYADLETALKTKDAVVTVQPQIKLLGNSP